jgi:hypothetical protein
LTPRRRFAVIGHITAEPNVLEVRNEQAMQRLLSLRNYTRVVAEDGKLYEHLSYLQAQRGIPPLSVWEMYLCSTLLLGTHLRRHGFDVHLTNFIDSDNEDRELAALRAYNPDVVVLSTTFVLSKQHLVRAVKLVKTHLPGAFVVCGGQHVFTALLQLDAERRRQYLVASGADAFINDSQGEASLLELCRSYPDALARVPNLIWTGPDGTVVENGRAPEQNDINWTPLALDAVQEGAVVHLRTARSCTFKCAFCSYPTVAGKLALMDLDLVLATLRACADRGVKAIFFVDDTFNVPRDRFEALLDRIIDAGLTLPWYSFLRCQFIDERLVQKMKRSGCRGVFLGVESASDAILKAMQKGAAADAYRNGIRWLRDAGITTVGSFVLGFPGETRQTVDQTHEFIVNAGLDYYYIQPFYYLHHAPIHQKAKRFQLKGEGLFWTHGTMTSTEALEHIHRLFLEIREPLWVNPDMTLWEIAYLESKGLSRSEIDDYRRQINAMTAAQMRKYGIASDDITSRALGQAQAVPGAPA